MQLSLESDVSPLSYEFLSVLTLVVVVVVVVVVVKHKNSDNF